MEAAVGMCGELQTMQTSFEGETKVRLDEVNAKDAETRDCCMKGIQDCDVKRAEVEAKFALLLESQAETASRQVGECTAKITAINASSEAAVQSLEEVTSAMGQQVARAEERIAALADEQEKLVIEQALSDQAMKLVESKVQEEREQAEKSLQDARAALEEQITA
eukprot:616802-Rhodomonas_salina.1